MAKSKVNMPEYLRKKCHAAIHSASIIAGASGAIPLPFVDTIPISAAQVTMIVALGKVFDVKISKSVAKSIAGVGAAQMAGKTVASGIKAIPGVGTVIGIVGNTVTAAAITEALGWLIANDFYRMSIGEEPEDLIENASELKGLFRK